MDEVVGTTPINQNDDLCAVNVAVDAKRGKSRMTDHRMKAKLSRKVIVRQRGSGVLKKHGD